MLPVLILAASYLAADPAQKDRSPEVTVVFNRQAKAESDPGKPAVAAKLNPPGPADEATGIKAVRDVMGDEIAKAKSPAEKVALSGKMLTLANETKDDVLARWGAFQEAIRLASEAANPVASFASIEAEAGFFLIDIPKTKLRVLREIVEGPPAAPLTAQGSIAKAAIAASKEAELVDDYECASALADIAFAAAVKAKDVQTRELADKSRAAIKIVAKDFETASKAIASSPDDPAANLAWGRFLALGRGDWAKGLPFLAKASGEAGNAAKDDLSNPTDAAAQAGLAEQWWALAEKEKEERFISGMKGRAGWWYAKALPGLSGLAKAKAEKRIAEAAASTQTIVALKQPIELLKNADVKKGAAVGDWRVVGKALGIENGKFARFEFPEESGGEYRLTLDVEAGAARSTFGIYLPIEGERGVAVVLDTSKGSFVAASKSPVSYGETVFQARKRTKIDCVVRRGSIEVLVNDKRIMLWEGDTSTVAIDPGEGWLDGKGKVSVGTHNASVVIRSITLSPATR